MLLDILNPLNNTRMDFGCPQENQLSTVHLHNRTRKVKCVQDKVHKSERAGSFYKDNSGMKKHSA